MKIANTAYLFITFFAVLTMLILGKSILIPLLFSILIWLTIRSLNKTLDKIAFIRKTIPAWLKNIFISLLVFLIIAILSQIIIHNLIGLTNVIGSYQINFNQLIETMNSKFNLNIQETIQNQLKTLNLSSIFSSILQSVTGLFSNALIILFYVIFIILEETHFKNKLEKAIPNTKHYEKIQQTLIEIEKTTMHYLGLKTLISIITGFFSFIVLLLIGVEFAAFWAFLIFLLNFIPNIGSLIATLFPALFCLLQFGDIGMALLTLAIISIIQVVVGNFLEPKLMGDSLNISPLFAIFSLIFWGSIWGISGLILSIPITVIIINILAKFPKSKTIAIMLSEKGNV